MKAISLWQPWASLWVTQGAKIHETRGWPTKHRGPLAIHASKKMVEAWDFPADARQEIRAALNIRTCADWERLPRGAIVGVVVIEDCVPTSHPPASTQDEMFGNWAPGRYAFRRQAGPMPLSVPVPCRGFQGIWNLDAAIEAQVHAQMDPNASCPSCGGRLLHADDCPVEIKQLAAAEADERAP